MLDGVGGEHKAETDDELIVGETVGIPLEEIPELMDMISDIVEVDAKEEGSTDTSPTLVESEVITDSVDDGTVGEAESDEEVAEKLEDTQLDNTEVDTAEGDTMEEDTTEEDIAEEDIVEVGTTTG